MKWERQQKVLLLGFLIWEPEGRQAFCLKKKSCFIEFLIWDRDSRQHQQIFYKFPKDRFKSDGQK